MLETGLSPLARGHGYSVDLVGETDMTDILTRVLLGGLGVFLIFLGVAMLVVRGIAGSLRSICAPRVIIIQNDSSHERQPGLTETGVVRVTAIRGRVARQTLSQARDYAVRARHSANAAVRLCL
jgi:hypothetical protein